jgi:hypothetical protein
MPITVFEIRKLIAFVVTGKGYLFTTCRDGIIHFQQSRDSEVWRSDGGDYEERCPPNESPRESLASEK